MRCCVAEAATCCRPDPDRLENTLAFRTLIRSHGSCALRRLGGMVLLGAVLAGCSATPDSRYYSLSPALQAGEPSTAAQAAGRPAQNGEAATAGRQDALADGAIRLISVQPVRVPDQVDQAQIVVGSAGSDALTRLQDSQWSSPLPEELRRAVSLHLTSDLGAIDLPVADLPAGQPAWKVNLAVNRFDSLYQDSAAIEATWRLVPIAQPEAPTLICRRLYRAPAGPGVDGLVRAHRELVAQWSTQIAAQLRSVASSGKPNPDTLGCTVLRHPTHKG